MVLADRALDLRQNSWLCVEPDDRGAVVCVGEVDVMADAVFCSSGAGFKLLKSGGLLDPIRRRNGFSDEPVFASVELVVPISAGVEPARIGDAGAAIGLGAGAAA